MNRAPAEGVVADGLPQPPAPRKPTPIKWFATAGALAIALQAYVFSRWILSGPRPTEGGADEVPEFMQVGVLVIQIISPLLMVVCLYYFVVRPWRRERTIGLPGVLALALPTAWWQDMAFNYFNPAVSVNTEFINFGSWYSFIPGWASPNGERLVEPLLWTGPTFIWAILPQAVLVAFLMGWAQRRRPRIGKLGLFSVAVVATAFYDLLLELFFLRLGMYTYVGAIPELTLFSGEYYQFPLYEAPMFGLQFAVIGALLFFRSDNGDSIAERGIHLIKTTPRKRFGLRFLAVSGFINVTWLVYNLMFALVTMLPGFAWAEDVVENRSYLRDELCGAGTTYACPSADVPIPRDGGARIGPDGRLIVPPDAVIPGSASD